MGMLAKAHRDDVFTAGGQPTITYVDRKADDVELKFARAIATPNQIVSLSGPTKTGKTVLCRKMLGEREYLWIDGGQIDGESKFWERACYELNIASGEIDTSSVQVTGSVGANAVVMTAAGSRLSSNSTTRQRNIDTMAAAISTLTARKIILVIDDFHYLSDENRKSIVRNIKGAVFNGLKIILLSVTHRVFDAIKAEAELTGRFTAISLPHWSEEDLTKIPYQGFAELGVNCPEKIVKDLSEEAQESPFLMQKFCWEICFDLGIERSPLFGKIKVPEEYNLASMFQRLSLDAGLPIYQKLAAGPQSRKVRAKRPLAAGGEADIYQAILLGLAATGPSLVVSYDQLRAALARVLSDQVPQKHEITSALKHLARIAKLSGVGSAIDWDDDKREVNLVDPYLRFYLRWQIRPQV
jgi:hypothetical protein